MSSSENQNLPPWTTYRMDISPTGQAAPTLPHSNDPIAILNLLVNLQSQSIDLQRQIFDLQRQTAEMQKQQLDLLRESTQVARDQRARQNQELERWQNSHDVVLTACKNTLGKLEQVHAALMVELSEYVANNYDNLLEGDFSLSEFVDRFGPRLAHLNTMLAVLRPLAAAQPRKLENS